MIHAFSKETYSLTELESCAFWHECMASESNIFGEVINCVYTWIPKTPKNGKRPDKDSRKRKKRMNFSQPLNQKGEVSYRKLEGLESSHGLPSTPTGSKFMLLRSIPDKCTDHWRFSQKPSNCNLRVVGCKFLSNEKKISKRSALKKWLHQRTNVVHHENFHLHEQFSAGGRHTLCFREVFECSPRLAGKMSR